MVERLDSALKDMRECYWKQRDLAGALAIAAEGIAEGKARASASLDPSEIYEILSRVKALCYDTASFSWPGWDEQDLAPTAEQAEIGLKEARDNLMYAMELQKPDLAISRGFWMLGAHQLTAGDYPEATINFTKAAEYAAMTDRPAEVDVCHGFSLLTRLAAGDETSRQELAELLERMGTEGDSGMFASQIRAASKVIQIPIDA